MFRARTTLFLAALVALLLPVTAARAQERVNTIDGVVYVDYSRPAAFKIGSWVKYHTSGKSQSGLADEYDVLFRIGGEEKFWGEDCFWLESAVIRDGNENVIASCVTYDAFGDSLSDRPELFERKTVLGNNEEGKAEQNLMWRERHSYRSRQKDGGVTVVWDTIGTDTVMVPKGTFNCLKVVRREAVAITKEIGDSTFRGETYNTRTFYYAKEVPITSLVREDVETKLVRQAWRAGNSENMVQRIEDQGTATMRLLDWGEGAKAVLVPEAFRKPIKRSKPPARTASGR